MKTARAAGSLLVLAALPCALGALGCKEEDGALDPRASCRLPYDGRALAGEWELRARGTRKECDDPSYQGELVLRTSVSIAVAVEPKVGGGADDDAGATDGGPSATGSGGGRTEYVLSLGPSAPEELTLQGGTVGSCVSFTLTESLRGSDALVYEFDGAITADGLADGDLRGEGPEGCLVEGSFVLEAR